MYAIQSGIPKSAVIEPGRYISRIPIILNIRTGDVTEVIVTPICISKLVNLLTQADVHPAGTITFDFETTGLDPDNEHITEYAFYHTQLRTTVAHSLVKPPTRIPLDVQQLTGITE